MNQQISITLFMTLGVVLVAGLVVVPVIDEAMFKEADAKQKLKPCKPDKPKCKIK